MTKPACHKTIQILKSELSCHITNGTQFILMYNYMTNNINQQKKEITKRHFTPEEDNRLRALVEAFNESNWASIAYFMPGRSQRQCRERYIGYLSPHLNTSAWSPEEDCLLIQKLQEYGPKWTTLVQFFKNRSDSNIKNRWYKHLKKHASPLIIKQIEKMKVFYTQKKDIKRDMQFMQPPEIPLYQPDVNCQQQKPNETSDQTEQIFQIKYIKNPIDELFSEYKECDEVTFMDQTCMDDSFL